MNWDDIRLFSTIAEEGSFRRAALKLNLGHTTLSRRIEALEEKLGTRLLNRFSRGLTLTPAGEDMLMTAAPMSREFDDLQLRLFGRDSKAEGTISLTAPGLLVNYLLLAPLDRFARTWPGIKVEVNDSLEVLDLSAREADIALRMTNNPSDQLIGRKVGVYLEAAYASPEYLATFAASTEKLHRWIYPGGDYEFRARLLAPYASAEPPRVQITMPNVYGQMGCAVRGMGLAMLPCLMGDANPDLVRISPPVHRTDIWMLAHKDSRSNKRMQLFREFLVEVFAAEQNALSGGVGNGEMPSREPAIAGLDGDF